MLTGVLDQHPREAMALMKSDRKDDFAGFYRSLTEDPGE